MNNHIIWRQFSYVCYLGNKQIYEVEKYKILLPFLELRQILKEIKE